METTEKLTTKKGVINESLMQGRWKLTYTVENSLGNEAFGGMMLEPFVHPITKTMVFPMDGSNTHMPGFWVDKLVTMFLPDKQQNNEHYNAVMFLLGHPSVRIENIKVNSAFARMKKGGGQLSLVNLDYEKEQQMDDQEIIDSMIGRLSLDLGKHAVSLEKMQWILAKLNIAFYDKRYIGNNTQLKRVLRTKLKDFVRKGKENAQAVADILDNIEAAKKVFLIKYLIDFGVLEFTSGSIRHDGQPIGFNIESAVDYLTLNPEHYLSLQEILDKKLKEEEV